MGLRSCDTKLVSGRHRSAGEPNRCFAQDSGLVAGSSQGEPVARLRPAEHERATVASALLRRKHPDQPSSSAEGLPCSRNTVADATVGHKVLRSGFPTATFEASSWRSIATAGSVNRIDVSDRGTLGGLTEFLRLSVCRRQTTQCKRDRSNRLFAQSINDFPPQNASRCEPVNVGICPQFQGDLRSFYAVLSGTSARTP